MQAIGGIQKTLNTLTLGADVQVDQARRENLLQSLKFPGFNERRNQIAEAYEKTFHWIFMGDDGPSLEAPMGSDSEDSDWEDSDLEDVDLADPAEASWDLFSNWLSSTARIYWISGKPGSGKTTLVKYILNHPKTATYLDIWSPRALTISHFFWRPGNKMQQSIKGLLCSLLYQLLENSVAATDHVLQHIQDQRLGVKDGDTDWSVPELRSTFLQLLNSYECPTCIFIDGLDEVDPADGPLELLDLVEQFSRCCNTKLCLASRPEPILQGRLSSYPLLRVQDLTRADLDRYALDHLKLTGAIEDENCPNSFGSLDEPWRLRESIVDKAEGVFLWLVLAIKNVNKGFIYGDTLAMIRQRIDSLPSDLTNMYKDMWTRACEDSPKSYRQIAALYLRLVLFAPGFSWSYYFPRPSTIQLMLASTSFAGQLLDSIQSSISLVPEEIMLKECRDFERKVELCCFGLVEFTQLSGGEDVVGWYGSRYDRLWSCFGQRYPRLIHRTARDFLLDTVDGKAILAHDVSAESSLFIRWLKAHLATSQLYVATRSGYLLQGETCVVNRVETYTGVLHNSSKTFGPRDPNWTQIILYLERLCSSGQLFSGMGAIRVRSCGGIDFLKVAASICCHESTWPVVRMRTLSMVMVSEMLLNLCDSIRMPVNQLNTCTVEHGIIPLLREGADPNWRGTTFSPEGHLCGEYSQVKTPFTAYLESLTTYLEHISQGRWNIMRLEQNRIAEVLGNLHSFLSCSAHLSSMLTLGFQHVHFGDSCKVAFAPRGMRWVFRDDAGQPHFRESVIVSFSAHNILQTLLDYICKDIEHPRCRQGVRYEEIMSLIDSIQTRLDSCSKRDDGRVVGMLGLKRYGERHGLRNISRKAEPVWYVPTKECPVGVADKLQKELGRWLNMEDRSRSRRCRIVPQLVQQMSWTVRAIGTDDIWNSLAEIGELVRVDYELHDLQGWVDKFQKHRSVDGSLADGIVVAQNYPGGANT